MEAGSSHLSSLAVLALASLGRNDDVPSMASVAGVMGLPANDCDPSRPISVIDFHGTADLIVQYNGLGPGYPPVVPMMEDWAARNGCSPVSEVILQQGDVSCETGPAATLASRSRCARSRAAVLPIPRSFAVTVALVGLAPLASAGPLACSEEATDPAPAHEQPPAPVEVATARAGELVDEWVFVGEVRSLRSAALALGAGGEIVMIEVREGDRVEAGDLLVEIDKRQASAELSAAVSSRRESERELEQARREAERAAALGGEILPGEEIERGAVRAETLEVRKLRLGAQIRAAKAQLSDYQLSAPFAGVVAARRADLGQWVNPGETVLELVATDEVEILVEVRPELAPQLRVGAAATLRPSGGVVGVGERGPSEVTAELRGVVPSLDRSTRTLTVRLVPREPRPWLIPGAPIEVGFPLRYQAGAAATPDAGPSSAAVISDAVIIPRDALVLGAVDTRVVVVVDGAAKPVLIEVHATTATEALVSGAGLSVGAIVVTRGNERLRPGQAVAPRDGGQAEGGGPPNEAGT